MTPNPENADTAIEPVAAAQVRSEVQEYLETRQQRRRLFPRAALVGLVTGLVAVAFRVALAAGDTLRNRLIATAHGYPLWGWLLPLLWGAGGATLAVLLVRRLAPEAAGSGIPHLEAVLHRHREIFWRRLLPVKFVGGTLALASGLALGREGPTVQMGGAVGAALADASKATTRDRLVLIAAGAGAGLAAAFNAPLAGLIFVLEEVQKDFRPIVFGAAFLAAAVANIVARFASGQLPVFQVPAYPAPDLKALPFFVVLGLVCGALGVAYNRGLLATLNLAGRIPPHRFIYFVAATGAAIGLVAWFAPDAVGGGHTLTETLLDGRLALAAIPAWFAVRFVLSLGSYATGAPGGIFAPLLGLGALIGLAVGQTAHLLMPQVVTTPAVFAVVGMAAYFTAIVRAPLTGIVLIIEMTGNYGQMLPLLVTCFVSYIVAEGWGQPSIYESLLERDLRRGGAHPEVSGPVMLELEVEPGSPFAGRRVKDLGLPPGCILVLCRNSHREWVPTATTLLEPHTRLSAVIAPDAPGGADALRRGCARNAGNVSHEPENA